MGPPFRLFSDSPLRKIGINVETRVVQNVSLDQVISLESSVELDYPCDSAGSILPSLNLPRLKRLRVLSSLGPGPVQKLADVLLYSGGALLAGAPKASYHSKQDTHSLRVELSGNGLDVSFGAFYTTADSTTIDWLFDQTRIPRGGPFGPAYASAKQLTL